MVMMVTQVDNTQDVLDSRDIVERVAQLQQWSDCTVCGETVGMAPAGPRTWVHNHSGEEYCGTGDGATASPSILDEDEVGELWALSALLDQLRDVGEDSPEDGLTLVRDSHFVEYAQELADDLGAVPSEYTWPTSCIDWEQAARELRMDYSSVEFGGVTYWVR